MTLRNKFLVFFFFMIPYFYLIYLHYNVIVIKSKKCLLCENMIFSLFLYNF